MHEIVVSDLFDINNTKDYTLSIQINLGGFSFSIISSELDLIAYKNIPLTITNARFLPRRFEEWCESEDILKMQFKEVSFIYDSREYTLIPDKYYESSQNYNLLKTVLDIDEEAETEANKVDNLDLWIVYRFPKLLKVRIGQRFPMIKLLHPLKNCLENIPHIEPKENGIILLFNSNYLNLILFRQDKFLMANSFPILHRNDVIFYTFSVLKQYHLSVADSKVFFTGKIPDEEKTIHELKNYFPATKFLEPSKKINVRDDIFKMPKYHLYSLLSSI